MSDKEAFKIWHDNAFNRRTFEGLFYDETAGHDRNIHEFETGIAETKIALQTGVCYRQGKELKKGKGIDDIKKKESRDKIREVIGSLTVIEI